MDIRSEMRAMNLWQSQIRQLLTSLMLAPLARIWWTIFLCVSLRFYPGFHANWAGSYALFIVRHIPAWMAKFKRDALRWRSDVQRMLDHPYQEAQKQMVRYQELSFSLVLTGGTGEWNLTALFRVERARGN